MAVVGSADVLVRPNFKGFQTAARQAGMTAGAEAGQSLTSRLGSQVSKWAKRGLIGAGVATGAAFIGGVKSGLDQQASTLVLTGLYDNVDLAKSTMKSLNEVVKDSPLAGKAFYSGAESLAYAGLQGEEAVKVLENVGNVIVGAGGSEEAMSSFTEAMLSGVNRGKFSMMELNRISGAGVPIYDALAEHIGVSSGEIQDMASKGQIGMEDVVTVLEKADSKFFELGLSSGELAKQSLPNQWKRFWGGVTTELGEKLQPALAWVQEWFADFASRIGPKFKTFLDAAEQSIKAFVQQWRDGEGIGGAFRSVIEAIGDALRGAFDYVTGTVVPALQSMWEWMKKNEEWLVPIAAGVGAIVLAWKAYQTGLAVARGVTVAFTAVQAALNAVLNMNPIGLVVLALTGLVAAFVTAYKNSETFRKIVDAAWEGIKTAAEWAWNFLKDYVFAPIVAYYTMMWEAAMTAKDWIVEAWGYIKEGALVVWDFLKEYVFSPIISYYTMMWEAAVAAKDFVVGAWDKIKEGALVVWDFLKKYVFKPITKYYETLWGIAIKAKDLIVGAWDKIYDGAMAAWGWLRDNVFTPLGNKIDDMKAWFRVAKDVVTDQWDTLKENIRKPYDWLRDNVFDKLKKLIKTTIPNAFEDGKDAIKKAWDKVKDIAKKPVNFLIGTVYNSGIRKMWNKVATKFGGAELPYVQKLATGGAPVGRVSGPGGTTADRVPAMLSHGEHVLSAREVTALGGHGKVAQLRAMARAGEIPAFGFGGWIGEQWGKVKRASSSAWNSTKDFAKHAADPITWIKDAIKAPLKDLGEGPFPDMLKKIPTAILDGLNDKFKDKFTSGNTWGDSMGPPPMHGGWSRPSRGPVTSEFGFREHPVTGGRRLHAGIDIGGGGPTYAAARGTVKHTGFHPLSGYNIVISHGGGVETKYFHNPSMNAIRVSPGQDVTQGQHIGQQGATGRVTGTHLHFEYHKGGSPQNPRNLGVFDKGGLLQPGALAYHSSTMSKPDAVLTSSQWAAISKLAGSNSQGGPTYNAYISPQSGGSPDEIADSVLYSMRRLQRGGVHAR